MSRYGEIYDMNGRRTNGPENPDSKAAGDHESGAGHGDSHETHMSKVLMYCVGAIIAMVVIATVVYGFSSTHIFEYDAIVGASIPNGAGEEASFWKTIRTSSELQMAFIMLGLIVSTFFDLFMASKNPKYFPIAVPVLALAGTILISMRCIGGMLEYLNVYFALLGTFYLAIMGIVGYTAYRSAKTSFLLTAVLAIVVILFGIMAAGAFNTAFDVKTGADATAIINNVISIIGSNQ